MAEAGSFHAPCRRYQKKDGKSNGVMQLMDNMVEELKTEHTEAKHEEETAQKDYEDLMAASQKSRSKAAESITEKESASSEWTEKIENAKTDSVRRWERNKEERLESTSGLHLQCCCAYSLTIDLSESHIDKSRGI